MLKITGLFIGILASTFPAEASSWTLEKVVSLSRHGVRPQTNTEKLDKGTNLHWPKFGVEDGHLTGHGYTGMWQQARYQLQQWNSEGLNIQIQCPKDQLFLWTGPSQRIKTTGKAITDGMFPGCGISPLSVNAKYGPLFELYHLHEAHPDKKIMREQIMKRMGSPEQAATRYKEAVEHLRHTVCAKNSCSFLDKPWGVKFKSTGKPKLEGPGKLGATMGETIRLQYSDNLPIKEVAFGHGIDAEAVKDFMAIHAAQYNFALDTPEFAAHSGSLLMRQILAALTSGTRLHQQWSGDSRLNRPLVMFVGHDTNIAETQTLMGFKWTLAGYPSNDIPPGGTISFARFHQKNSNTEFVRVRFSARSLDQWRTLSPLNEQNPLLHADLYFNGCQKTDVGTLCPLNKVVKRASQLLVDDGIHLPLFKTN